MPAVAMLMCRSEPAYAALGKTADRHDQVRYLLLRIRELSPDKFAAEHLQEHTAPGVLWAMPDVFPVAESREGPQVFGGVAGWWDTRISTSFGYARRGDLTSRRKPASMPDQWERMRSCRRFSTSSSFWRWVGLGAHAPLWRSLFAGGRLLVQRANGADYAHRANAPLAGAGLCPLPEVKLPPERAVALLIGDLPWWIEPYVPAAHRADTHFREPKPGEKPPAVVSPRFSGVGAVLGKEPRKPPPTLDPSAPSVVVLPPRLPQAADASAVAAAGLLCDRLAEDIAAEGVARVVDRGELDRVSRSAAPPCGVPRPMLSYDAMIRLELDVASLVPEVRLDSDRLVSRQRDEGRAFPLAGAGSRRGEDGRSVPRGVESGRPAEGQAERSAAWRWKTKSRTRGWRR